MFLDTNEGFFTLTGFKRMMTKTVKQLLSQSHSRKPFVIETIQNILISLNRVYFSDACKFIPNWNPRLSVWFEQFGVQGYIPQSAKWKKWRKGMGTKVAKLSEIKWNKLEKGLGKSAQQYSQSYS